MKPFRVLLLRKLGSPAPSPISYVGSGAMLIQASATTLGLDCPIVAAGDLLVAAVLRRSAVAVDPPPGWLLVSSVGPVSDGGSSNQWTHIYTKQATGAEGGTTVAFAQATAGRMLGQIIALRGSTGTPVIDGSPATNSFSATNTNQIALPVATSSAPGAVAVAVGSFHLASVSPTPTLMSLPSWTLRSSESADQNRLLVATKSLSVGQTTEGTITSSFDAGNTGATAHAIIFKNPAAIQTLYDRIMALAPVFYCRNGEASGTVMIDEVNTDGEYVNGVALGQPPLYPGGPTSAGGNFSGTRYARSANPPASMPAMSLLTATRPTDVSGFHLVGFNADNYTFNIRRFQWRTNGTALEFIQNRIGVDVVSVPGMIAANTTYLLGFDVDAAGNYKMYRNGLLIKQGAITPSNYGGGEPFTLGFSDGSASSISGTTSENAVFDKAVGPAAHAAMFAAFSGLDSYFRRWSSQGMADTDSYGTFDGTSYNRVVDGKLRLNSAARMTAARVRLNDVPDMVDFEAVFSVTIPTDDAFGVPNAGLIYRTYYWSNDNDTFGYVMSIRSAGVQFGHGSMSSTPGYSDIIQVSRPMDPGTTHTVRVRVEGPRHRVWIDDDAAPVLDNTNTWSLDPGGFGLNSYVGSSGQMFIDIGDVHITPLNLATPAATYWNASDKSPNVTLSDSNKAANTASGGPSQWSTVRANNAKTAGKWYFEVKVDALPGGNSSLFVGVDDGATAYTNFIGTSAGSVGFFAPNGGIRTGNNNVDNGGSYYEGDVIGVAYDADTGKLWFSKNGVWVGTIGSPTSGTSAINLSTGIARVIAASMYYGVDAQKITLHPDSGSQSYAPPAGFSAWG